MQSFRIFCIFNCNKFIQVNEIITQNVTNMFRKLDVGWNPVSKTPEGPNRMLLVYNEKAVFDAKKKHLLFWRKEEGFPYGITHWTEEPKDP